MNYNLKIIFAGSPQFAADILKKLIKVNKPCLVLTRPPRQSGRGKKLKKTHVHELSDLENIPVLHPKSLKNGYGLSILQEFKPDLILVAAYGLIIPQDVLDLPRYGCINFHTSKLPMWRGAAPVQRAIINGDKTTALTIMQMDATMDTGDIILQEDIVIEDFDTYISLLDKMAQVASNNLEKLLYNIKNNNITKLPQDHSKATLAPKIDKAEGRINWNSPAITIDCKIRGLFPNPGSFCFNDKGERIKILSAKVFNKDSLHNTHGTIIIASNKLLVHCNPGLLEITKIQLNGKKPINTEELIRTKSKFLETTTFFK